MNVYDGKEYFVVKIFTKRGFRDFSVGFFDYVDALKYLSDVRKERFYLSYEFQCYEFRLMEVVKRK